ncbi:MFS transporter [Anoxybacillus suryakundensis]|uniref:Predicted arabinose efflux permease, MFS family n=1 Tax=Anoxybacillus suryakundensis TaxID=1325335 RepID=A0A0K6GKW1_9BACL|nr:MFS transporter [Anoxybacillus suryakundensis]CUA79126.1 Predicted arabinose efflux permease, MFS family [Anoxybacillus suryakundensis]
MNDRRYLPLLFVVMFLVMMGFGIIIPVLPFYAEKIGATPTQLGWLMAVYSFMQFLFAPMWGKLSDRYGRKPMLLIGIFGLALSFFLFALATKLWMLFAARIIGGFLSAATMPTAMAYVADVTTEENRGKGMGIIGAAVGLGFIFGPAIGGVFSKHSLTVPFWIAGSLALVTTMFVFFFLHESLPKEKRANTQTTRPSLMSALQSPLARLYVLQLIVTFSLAGLEATFAYFAAKRAGLSSTELGYIFMIMGLAGAIVQGGLLGKLIQSFGEGTVIRAGLFLSALGFSLILFIHNFWTAALYLTIFGIGNGVIRPCVSALLTKHTTDGQGSATGMLSSFDSLGRIGGPAIAGWLFTVKPSLPYMTGIILTFVSFALFQSFQRTTMQKGSA